jgi:UDP-N-acetylglucosamine 1-carboxyvinyltransferase
MSKASAKIGSLIQSVRQERNMTQKELAQLMGTSQSAINRIEKGQQNLSIEILERISESLDKQLININRSGAVNLRIEGKTELNGEIILKKSKNSAVAILCASILNHGITRLKSVPKIEEVHRIIEVLESIGVKIKWVGNDLEIRRPKALDLDKINVTSARKTRSIIMLLGALLHEYDSFKIPYAGGCKLGERTVRPHLYSLEEFGLKVKTKDDYYEATVNVKQPDYIVLYEAGNTVTNNCLIAAAGSSSKTIIQGASADYMVQDLCYFLQKIGVKIDGIGTSTLTVVGVKNIKKNIEFSHTEDPIEAMFFISAAVATNSSITIKKVPHRWIGLELLKLKKMGLEFTVDAAYPADNGATELVDITILKHNFKIKAPAEKLHPNLWPGINPDNIPYFVPICGTAEGQTLIHDWMFENRAIYYTEMTKIGMTVDLADRHRIFIKGPTKWNKADVVCPPALRPASLLLIGMMCAEGVSVLRNVYTINRGYEDIAARLNSLGARIKVVSDI